MSPGLPRYRLHAFVCAPPQRCVVQVHNEGTITLSEVLHRRPDHCRYAVLEQAVDRTIILADLWDVAVFNGTRLLADAVLGKYATMPSVDAAIAAASIDYDNITQ